MQSTRRSTIELNYNFLRDIVPIVGVIRSPFVLEVHPAVPVKTVSELIAYAKANSGKFNMASFGTGTSQSSDWRVVQDDDRGRNAACALSRVRTHAH